mmetsp:Transcript_5357/g.12871  ORF Transcript_5357/g.12871 Transcript_5357/m.12871 type:complete len:292 (-) Transcript_5357:462-1337(-)
METARAGSSTAWWLRWINGPKSVHICPMQLSAAHRTRAWGSERRGRMSSTTCARCFLISLETPSPVCDIAIRPAILYRQSCWFSRNDGTYRNTAGMNPPPPSAIAIRSRASCPTSKLPMPNLPPSSSSSDSSPPSPLGSCAAHFSTSMLGSRSLTMRLRETATAWSTKLGTFFIMPGAFSLSSTRRSSASCLVDASSVSVIAICTTACTTSPTFGRKNLACSAVRSIIWSSPACARFSSSPTALTTTDNICGSRGCSSRVSRALPHSSRYDTTALRAALRTAPSGWFMALE